MREIKNPQMKFGEVDISDIEFDYKSRDEIPKLLKGLQHIYTAPEIKDEIFKELRSLIKEDTSICTGRPGMDLWKILVLGTLRLNCNWDYDKLQEMANNHNTLRQMLGHGTFDSTYYYPLQTLRDNIGLFTPEVLDKINQIVVKAGLNLVKKKGEEGIKGRCDSFVVETDVHYPTDINLGLDAIRKVVTLMARLCSETNSTTWRQSAHYLRKVKRFYRQAQRCKVTATKNEKQKKKQLKMKQKMHRRYINLINWLLKKAGETFESIKDSDYQHIAKRSQIEMYMDYATKLVDLIKRRVLDGEVIPQSEKIYSIFEPYTEWISKGKAGVPQELGLKVCIVESHSGFILHHRIMQKKSDVDIAVSIIQETKERFPSFNACSFDKGFHNPENQIKLNALLPHVVLPKKGKLSLTEKKIENSEEFVSARKKHSAVESGINALENHGLDRCLDFGLIGFKRYVGLAILARNIQVIGHILQQKEKRHLDKLKGKTQQQKFAA